MLTEIAIKPPFGKLADHINGSEERIANFAEWVEERARLAKVRKKRGPKVTPILPTFLEPTL